MIEILFEWLSPNFMKNAFFAVLLAAPLFGAMGTVVVTNQMAFFSDAIGHSALAGIAIGVLFGIKEPTVAMVLFSVFLGFAIMLVKSKGNSSADTIIGVFSSTATALGVVLLTSNSNFAKYSRYLVGDLLSIEPKEIWLLLATNVFLILIFVFFYNKILLTSLHRTFAKSRGVKVFFIEQLTALVIAVIVTISIRWTGLLVINSLLVLPAASARMNTKNAKSYIGLSILFSLFASVAGLIISYYCGTATGATIVLVCSVIFALSLIVKNIKKGK